MTDKPNAHAKLQKLLNDPSVSEIMINGAQKVFVEQHGKKVLTDISFGSEDEVLKLVREIYAARGKRVDGELPFGDVCMEDGTRINTILSPVSRFGVAVTIRKFSQEIQTAEDLVRVGTLNRKGLDFLSACVKARVNMIFSGGTGVGKTTALQMLSHYFDADERVVTIEDSAELKLEQKNWVSLETKSPDRDGRGEVTLRDLIRNALRMAPDRLVLGEIRGAESIDMMQAMAIGLTGTIGIVHGNSPREVASRLETMTMMSGINLSPREVRKIIGSAIQIIVHMQRFPDGSRKVVSITEIRGIDGGDDPQIIFNDLFIYKEDSRGGSGFDLRPVMRQYPLFHNQMKKMNLATDKVFLE
jgi:pilus assembly protein CpaF